MKLQPHLHGFLDQGLALALGRNKIFSKGLGSPEILADLPRLLSTVPAIHAPKIYWKKQGSPWNGVQRKLGSFTVPESAALPKKSRTARFEFLLPDTRPSKARDTPVVTLMASFGEEGFGFRRHWMARPLLKQGIGVILPENPFCGSRRTKDSNGPAVDTLSDFWLMATVAIQESRSIVSYLNEAEGFNTCGVAGISMGGNFAAIVAAMSPSPLAAALVISPHSPAPSFTRYGLRGLVDWEKLSECLQMDSAETFDYLKAQMELADISKWPVPLCPKAAIIMGGEYDRIVHPNSSNVIHRHWPGSTLRWLKGGHVSSVLLNRGALVKSVADSIELLKRDSNRL